MFGSNEKGMKTPVYKLGHSLKITEHPLLISTKTKELNWAFRANLSLASLMQERWIKTSRRSLKDRYSSVLATYYIDKVAVLVVV